MECGDVGPCGAGYCLNPELDVYYHIPASAKAVVYVFHGGSGSAQVWITGEMAYSLHLDFPALGEYGYVIPRTNTGGGLNVRAAVVYNTVAVPYYFGNYHPGSLLNPAAVPLAAQYTTPTIFNYGLNDDGNPTSEVEANADFLTTLPVPVPVEKNLAEPAPLRPDRFARVLGMSYAESRHLYAALVFDPAYVDAHGFVLPAADRAPVVLALNTPHHVVKEVR